jgi:serine/threonine protein kinase
MNASTSASSVPDPAAGACPRCGSPLRAAGAPCPRCALEQAAQRESIWSVRTDARPRDPAPTPAELLGRIPGYEVLELIGQGGMGAVYRARQIKLEREVALKLLAPAYTRDPSFRERFAREAQALARLTHPSIVTVHDYGEVEWGSDTRLCYLVMELVEGANLRDVLREGRLSPTQALALVPPICEALQYAHDRGIVHRDIKPENILLDAHGAPKVADFGLAKLVQGADPGLTASGAVLGTPKYMAPEQIEHPERVDHRADIYALGVVLYEMLTGELPLGRFELPSQKVRVDVRLDEVVLKALQKAPERRYQQASEMHSGVSAVQQSSLPPLAGPNSSSDSAVPGVASVHVQSSWGSFLRLTWLRGTGTAIVSGAVLLVCSFLPWMRISGGPVSFDGALPAAGWGGHVAFAPPFPLTATAWNGSVNLGALHIPLWLALSCAWLTCMLVLLRVATSKVSFAWIAVGYGLACAPIALLYLFALMQAAVTLQLGAYLAFPPLVTLGGAVWHLREARHAGVARASGAATQ